MSRPLIAIFTGTGRLIHYSEDPALVRDVASALLDELPRVGNDPGDREILRTRRLVLDRIAEGDRE